MSNYTTAMYYWTMISKRSSPPSYSLSFHFRQSSTSLPYQFKMLLFNGVLWTAAISLCMTVVYGTYSAQQGYHVISLAEAVLYNSLSRVTWSIGLSCLILTCSMGYGGWVNTFLSWKGFVPLSRLTYCAYLIHIPLIMILADGARSGAYYTYVTLSMDVLQVTALAYLVAFPFSLLFEAPFIGLDKLFLTPMSLKGDANRPVSKSMYAASGPLQASNEAVDPSVVDNGAKPIPS